MVTNVNGPRITTSGGTGAPDQPAARAYRRAWWALGAYPISFVAAFVVGEGLYTWVGGDEDGAPIWAIVAAGLPALVVFALPGAAAVVLGRRAMRLGRPGGRLPAIVGATIAAAFIALNLLSYLAQLVLG